MKKLILDPLQREVFQFVDQLRQQLLRKSPFKMQGAGAMDVNDSEMHVSTGGQGLPILETMEGLQYELPFEF